MLLYDTNPLKLAGALIITPVVMVSGRLKAKADGLAGVACPIQLV